MACNICTINNRALRNKIEYYLDANDGILSENNTRDLVDEFPMHTKEIRNITSQDCNLHWNFHRSAERTPTVYSIKDDEGNVVETEASFAADVGKDEVSLLNEVMQKQHATFTLLTNKINSAIEKSDRDDLSQMIIHPNTLIFYKDVCDSLRMNCRAIVDANTAVNTSKDGALAGLKALADAFKGSTPANEDAGDLSTKRYDD